MNKKNLRTLLIPSLQGQHRLWKSEILPQCQKSDAIVNFGNVIGCHPKVSKGANEATLTYVNLYRAYTPTWVQLMGPNEVAALNSPDSWTTHASIEHLQREWLETDGDFLVAHENNSRLQTHGGLTYGEWLTLDRPETAQEAAERLNEKYSQSLYQGPCLKLGDRPNFYANPIWADPFYELYPSWIGAPEDCPFDQIHSSASLNSTVGRRNIQTEESILSYISDTQFRSFGSLARVGNAEFIAIDLELNTEPIKKLPPLKTLLVEKTPQTNK